MSAILNASISDFEKLSTEELYSLYWDWYKEVTGVRPRWVDPNARETFLSFIEYELDPEVQLQREEEYEYEMEFMKRIEEEDALVAKEQKELEDAYDDTYFYIEEILGRK